MAIDPALITTKQVSELPPNPLSNTSLLAHQVGDILSQATILQLVEYVRAQAISQPYETKFLTIPQSEATDYINANFDMAIGATQGIGKAEGLWIGWAIHNGNNGSYNLDGQTLIGWGANYNTIGQFIGEETVTLNINQIPSHNHNFVLKGKSGGSNGITYNDGVATDISYTTESKGGGQAHNNMQPSMVCLMIYKLP